MSLVVLMSQNHHVVCCHDHSTCCRKLQGLRTRVGDQQDERRQRQPRQPELVLRHLAAARVTAALGYLSGGPIIVVVHPPAGLGCKRRLTLLAKTSDRFTVGNARPDVCGGPNAHREQRKTYRMPQRQVTPGGC